MTKFIYVVTFKGTFFFHLFTNLMNQNNQPYDHKDNDDFFIKNKYFISLFLSIYPWSNASLYHLHFLTISFNLSTSTPFSSYYVQKRLMLVDSSN